MSPLFPAIIQHAHTHQVLMLGYMNEEALTKTKSEGLVTFFSRSKNRLWTKGETSGNFLKLVNIEKDCDNDTYLVKVLPKGNTCHQNTFTCFGDKDPKGFLHELEAIVLERKEHPKPHSYTKSLFDSGLKKIAQKVGEEAVELILEAMAKDKKLFIEESADFFFHWLVLAKEMDISLEDIEALLLSRHKK